MVSKDGTILGEAVAGPGNIRLSIPMAVDSIKNAFQLCLEQANISQKNLKQYSFHAGIGLAGCESFEAREEFLKQKLPFDLVILKSDAYTACMGAHGGKNGAIIIAGTGVVGLKIKDGIKSQIGGWGFPHGDEGGGAWLGLEAVKKLLYMMDKQQKSSPLLLELKKRLGNNKDDITQWACNAGATQYAELTPLIVKHAKKKDAIAVSLLKQAACHIESLFDAFLPNNGKQQQEPCAFLGGMAPILIPYMKKKLQKRISKPLHDACHGALIMISQSSKSLSEKK